MKIRNVLFAATAMGLMMPGAQLVQAATPNLYDEAQLVPYVTYTSGGPTTVAGILATDDGTVYWSFHDSNGNQLHSGSFTVSNNDLHPFVWSTEAAGAATNLSGTVGYLVFGMDSTGNGQVTSADSDIGANAFYVDTANNDVSYIPTLDVTAGSLSDSDPTNWTNNPVNSLDASVADAGDRQDIQYLIDGASGGDDTTIYIWTTGQPPSSDPATIHDGSGASKPITLSLLNDNLNLVDLEANADVTAAFYGDGFMNWPAPTLSNGDNTFVFSIVNSPSFGAAQTLLSNFKD